VCGRTEPRRLLVWLIPERGDGDERGADGTFHQPQHEALRDEAMVVGAHGREDADDPPDQDGDGDRSGQREAGEEEGYGKDIDDVAVVELGCQSAWEAGREQGTLRLRWQWNTAGW